MESLIDSQHGTPTLLATIAAVLCLHLLMKMGEFMWAFLKTKNDASEETISNLTKALKLNTLSIDKLELRLSNIDKEISALPKYKLDIRRMFAAVKTLAGDEWVDIRKQIMDEDLDI